MKKFQSLIVGLLICLMQFSTAGHFQVFAQSTTGVYSVTVNTPGTFGQVMLQTVDNWSDVIELTVSGHLNGDDMAYFSRMLNITKLDVSNTDITSIGGCSGLNMLQSIVLPISVKAIDSEAFSNCSSLTSIELNNIETIGTSAFSNCKALSGSIMGPNVKTIGDKAFYNCLNIESISFPIIEQIGNSAFYSDNNYKLSSVEISNVKILGASVFENHKSLNSIDIRNCEKIGNECFYDCDNLIDVVLSDNLSLIPYGCFWNTGIQSINLPSSLINIGSYAFYETELLTINIPEGVKKIFSKAFKCPLESITLPSTLESIDNNAFYCVKRGYNSTAGYYDQYCLKNVYCKSVVPLKTSAFNNDMVKDATLYVPAFSVSAYKLDDNWYKFNKIQAIDGNVSDITINNTFTVIDYSGISDNANLTLTSSEAQKTAGHLTVDAGSIWSLNNYTQIQNFRYIRDGYYDENNNYVYKYTYPYCTTIIPHNGVRANNVSTKVLLPTNKWSFISFPYDVNVSSIIVPEGTMWVVRKYNGANRAAMSGDTWENVTSGQILNAGEGYIFHCIKEDGNTEYVEFEFPAINNSNKNNIFTYDDVVKTINGYPAEFPHNRGWNLIGNPYPSYLSSQYINFPAPITVWNGDGYTAYSLADDEYILRPNEAFFIQCPVATNQIEFLKDGRTHNYSTTSVSYYSNARALSANKRTILNFIISGDECSDRTRLVLNENASCDYEIERDASKFMSNNETVPQIYIIDNGVKYAINERPLGTGEYTLGVHIGKDGVYNISLNSKNSDYDVLLIDNQANKATNLAENAYSFESTSQTMNNRFTIKINAKGNQSSVGEVGTDAVEYYVDGNKLYLGQDVKILLYSIDGKLVHSGIVDDFIELYSGIYILSINGTTHKIAIK